jgi:hypothetical protein
LIIYIPVEVEAYNRFVDGFTTKALGDETGIVAITEFVKQFTTEIVPPATNKVFVLVLTAKLSEYTAVVGIEATKVL